MELQPVSGVIVPLYDCECPDCPCLMFCEIFEYPLCKFCKEGNHQEEGTIGAKEYANEVTQRFTSKVKPN